MKNMVEVEMAIFKSVQPEKSKRTYSFIIWKEKNCTKNTFFYYLEGEKLQKKYPFIIQKEKLAAPVNLRPAGWTGGTKKLKKARGENENKKKMRIRKNENK